jgi:methanogenic corrinoid protein MtbC1
VDAVLNRHSVVLPPDTLIFSVVLPILREAGARWEAGSIRPAHEHLVTAIIRSVLGGLLRAMPRWPDGDTMVFATLPGERHELGLLCAAVLAAHAGHAVTYLGPDLPAADILHVVNAIAASTLVVSATLPEVTSVRDVRQLRRLPPAVALWSGGGHGARVRREVGAHVRSISDLEQFARLVDRRRR